MRLASLRIAVISILIAFSAGSSFAGDKAVNFTTEPPGAQVEVNGSIICSTPCAIRVPSYYFGTHYSAFSKHGEVPITVRLLRENYLPKTLEITTGPIHWKNLYGNNLYDYYVVSSTQYNVRLDSAQEFFPANESRPTVQQVGIPASSVVSATLGNEEIVKNSMPAVVVVNTAEASGSGFLISQNGVVVTNAHVVRGHSSATVTMTSGKVVDSTSIYVDDNRDLALIKLPGDAYPYLRISHTVPEQGADVLAIGSPGVGATILVNSVTKGIVSGVRQIGDCIWIQTDTAINHGNSGGPLLNRKGEVVGVNTLRAPISEYSGMNFALASSEVDKLVRLKFGVQLNAVDTANATGLISVSSNPSGADIEVDGVFLGDTPAELPMAAGDRALKITKRGFTTFERKLHVIPGGKQSVSAELEPVK